MSKNDIDLEKVKKMSGKALVREGMKAVKEGRIELWDFKNMCEIWLEERGIK